MRPAFLVSVAAMAAGGLSLAPRTASADPTSWFAIGGGGAFDQPGHTTTYSWAGALTYSVGVGTSSQAAYVFGALARGTTMPTLGTDVGLAFRFAQGSFARGDWGIALDFGAAWRGWRDGTYGDWPLQVVGTLGAPWGFQVALGIEAASLDGGTPAQGGFFALEIDLLRLTVMRHGATEHWWPNPDPSMSPAKTASE